ncbi:1-hydroxycarotenoid 3,4-desaturase CrtD [Pollutibacter soli]|uniref:1-hydroxycarotenoid 3,4-desaturase CrtD n=1 Tax=Pollutibacter soli TaxID=3034157 RepID=UPI0030136A10
MSHKKAVVIGSGIAGLASAIRLIDKGYVVDLFEKNESAGGKLALLKNDGFVFDTGPSLFTQPEHLETIFSLAGEPLSSYFQYKRLDNACRYFFENGIIVNGYTSKEKFGEELFNKTGEAVENVVSYLQKSEERYHSLAKIFLNENLHEIRTWTNSDTISALKKTSPQLLFKSLNSFNKSRLKTPEAVRIFNRFSTYNGSNPFQAPAMLSIIPHLEHNEGVYYPKGGMISIINALYALAVKKGVCFHFNSAVNKIEVKDGIVQGIIANDVFYPSEIVLSNADVHFTYQNLLNDKGAANSTAGQERSSSALVFYWGINKVFPELYLHNIFFTKHQEEEFSSLFQLKRFYHDPTIYINITSTMEAGMAPAGMQNWFVMINAPSGTVFSENDLNEIRKSVLWKLNRMLKTRLEDHIVFESMMTPADITANTNAFEGALYGASSNNMFSAFRRHPNFSRKYRGLFFAGGTVHPGGGIPLCFRSASIAVDLATRPARS